MKRALYSVCPSVLTLGRGLALGTAVLVWVLIPGCPGVMPPDGGGGATGRLAGTVTNSVTGDNLASASVSLDPTVAGVSISTGNDGAFSESVPIGVYTVTIAREGFASQTKSISVNASQTTTVNAALVPSQAVLVKAAVSGDAVPGGSVSATATVEILDGATTVQGFAWSQSGSVDVTIGGASTANATVSLPALGAYKEELFSVLAEPPIGAEDLPPNVPLPEGEFPGGLQDRFQVVGLNPFALEEAGHVGLVVTVTTSSGAFTGTADIHTGLPWKPTLGINNVPVGVPVLLHGKTQGAYDWALVRPAGSTAALDDAQSQNPGFTPDVSGLYVITVTDETTTPESVVTLNVYAGTWQGAITGQDANGRPLAANCTICHNDTIAPDVFTAWKETGHAEIFTDNLNTSTHYGEDCFTCHSVGFDPEVANGGFDDASDYQDFLDAGLLNNPGDNWTTVLSDFPQTARLANIQCENCHGPNTTALHNNMELDSDRISLSSDVCASCHGEPLRHARFQQWQLSGHANYELAVDEGTNGSCARCHTANGFLAWLPVLLDDDPATDPLDNVDVTWTADETHPQTCATCHDPHDIGTTTGVGTNARVRIAGDTPPLIAGFQVFGAGRGAICMTCHNSRRGLRNDGTFDAVVASGDAGRAPHGSAQADVLMGENAFLVEVGIRGSHSLVTDTCVNCHMDQTPPPDLLSYNLGGTNHTFFASPTICSKCHEEIEAGGLQEAFNANLGQLQTLVENAILNLFADQIAAGNQIDLGGEAVITNVASIDSLEFGESHGQQAITVNLASGTTVGPVTVGDVDIQDAGGASVGALYDLADARLIKAGWNYNLANNDGSKGVHNPPFVFAFMDAAIDALNELAAE